MSVVTSWTVTTANNKNLYRRAKNINKNKELSTVNIRLVVTPMGKERTVIGEEKVRDVGASGVLARLYF